MGTQKGMSSACPLIGQALTTPPTTGFVNLQHTTPTRMTRTGNGSRKALLQVRFNTIKILPKGQPPNTRYKVFPWVTTIPAWNFPLASGPRNGTQSRAATPPKATPTGGDSLPSRTSGAVSAFHCLGDFTGSLVGCPIPLWLFPSSVRKIGLSRRSPGEE